MEKNDRFILSLTAGQGSRRTFVWLRCDVLKHREKAWADTLGRERKFLNSVTNQRPIVSPISPATPGIAKTQTAAASQSTQAKVDQFQAKRGREDVPFKFVSHVVGPGIVGATMGIAIGLAGPSLISFANSGCGEEGRCWLPNVSVGQSPLDQDSRVRFAKTIIMRSLR